MKTVFALAAIAVSGTVASAAIVTQWNFNSGNDANAATGTTLPFVGSGTASLVGGVTTPSFNAGGTTGIAPASSSDPNFNDNSGWQTTTYPAQGAANKTAGVQFAVSTAGFQDITISFDVRHSNTAANTLRLQYSSDGINFTDADQYTFTPAPGNNVTGDRWYNNRTADLSAITGIDNNTNFVIRIVTEFAPGSTGYLASRSTSTYGSTSTLRWDMVTINGTLIPTPGTAALAAIGGLMVARRRRA